MGIEPVLLMHIFLHRKAEKQKTKDMRKMERCRGFTIIELFVVLSVMVIISSIILVKHGEFQANLLLRSIAYEVALTIRQAQVYGLGIKEYQGISDPILAFQIGYGVHFETATPDTFFLFADLDNDRIYVAANDAIVESLRLLGGNTIVDLCAGADVNVGCGRSSLDIVYERPDPEAHISGANGTATIRIRSVYAKERVVSATITGQILVQ